MKNLYILLLVFVLGQQALAQNKNDFDVLRRNVLSQFDQYFVNIEMAENGNINLFATEAYYLLIPDKKNTIIEIILSKWNKELLIVCYQYKRELWKKDIINNQVKLIDAWDMNNINLPQTVSKKTSQKINSHPWFFYLGAGGTFSDETDDRNLNFSSRLGFFLLKNRWDLSISYTYSSFNTVYASTSSENANLGLMTKIYFPIRKINMSPYIGTGISYLINDTTEDTYNTPLYLGISWFIGSGSLDLGFQATGDNSFFTIGYTFSLWSK